MSIDGVTTSTPPFSAELHEIGSLVYGELVGKAELPKHIDAGQAMKEVRGILEIFTEYAHIEPARVIAYFEKIGAAGRQHRNLILREYDWPARTGSDGS